MITLLPAAWRFGKASRIGVAIAGTDADHYGQVPHGRPPVFTINRGKSFLDLPCLPIEGRSIASVPDKASAMSLEVRSVENLLGTPVPYAHAVKARPWLFLTGHEAYDWRTGMVDEAVSGPPGYPQFGHHHESRREADFIFKRMRRVLDEFGTDFAHSVRLDQYYPNARAVAAYHVARHEAFGD